MQAQAADRFLHTAIGCIRPFPDLGQQLFGGDSFVLVSLEIEQERRLNLGELIQIDVVDTVFADVLGTYRAELAGLSAEFTRDLTERDRLDALLNDKIARAKARFERRRDALRSGRPDGLDGEEADA